MEAYWRHSVDLVAAGSTLALLLAGDGLAPGIGSILTNLGAVMLLFSTVNDPEKDRWIMWPLYGYLSLHGFYAGGHHTSLPNIPWLLILLNYNHYFNEIFLNIYLLKSLYIYINVLCFSDRLMQGKCLYRVFARQQPKWLVKQHFTFDSRRIQHVLFGVSPRSGRTDCSTESLAPGQRK